MIKPFFFFFLSFVLLTSLFGKLVGAEVSKKKGIKELHQQPALSTEQDFEAMAIKLRQRAIESTRAPVVSTQTPPKESFFTSSFNRYGWKHNIFTTVFWIGERSSARNPVPNNKSTWDSNWARHFGGYDNPNPSARINFIPRNFIPKQNPFYCALPYNDIAHGSTKPEAARMIPWFKEVFVRPGQSVLKGRWVAIHYKDKTCFAQWEDCGPFRTDHASYVFGNERPLPNLNHGAGLDISPAVRDYLGMTKNDFCDWKFVDASSVTDGPWKLYGMNNTFWLLREGKDLKSNDPNNTPHQRSTYRENRFSGWKWLGL